MGRKKIPDSLKVSKPGVSLNAECREILRRVLEYELGEHRTEMTHSQVVRKCIRLAWEKHYAVACSKFEKSSVGKAEPQPHNRGRTLRNGGSKNPKKKKAA
jgi:hypothetical protein